MALMEDVTAMRPELIRIFYCDGSPEAGIGGSSTAGFADHILQESFEQGFVSFVNFIGTTEGEVVVLETFNSGSINA
jgi:hypothetical protein